LPTGIPIYVNSDAQTIPEFDDEAWGGVYLQTLHKNTTTDRKASEANLLAQSKYIATRTSAIDEAAISQ
jgi:hypothetical protein